MRFRSIADLRNTILRNIDRIPSDIDVVVGIPRSGMLPASIIALDLNRPIADLGGFAEGRLLGTGTTRKIARMNIGHDDVRHALVIDDSTNSGESIARARETLAPLADRIKLTFAAVYGVTPEAEGVDIILETVPSPRIFEWNVMHHPLLNNACLDIDGVLCHDPTQDENDDGPNYEAFISNARPLFLPTVRIGALVTSRLEKYRALTEAWLARNGIQYDKLVMLDVATAEERRRLGLHGKFKGEYYANSNANFFIESERDQAQAIANISGKPVLSIDGGVLCMPGKEVPSVLAARARRKARQGMGPVFKAIARRIAGGRR